jgi:hypothetical protein
MDQAPEPMPKSVTAHLGLSISGRTVRADITIPTRPVRIGDMLPVFQSLSELIVGTAVEAVEADGATVSCMQGCGACCRQLVAIPEVEACRIRDLVEAFPEPRRSAVKDRYSAASDSSGIRSSSRNFVTRSVGIKTPSARSDWSISPSR